MSVATIALPIELVRWSAQKAQVTDAITRPQAVAEPPSELELVASPPEARAETEAVSAERLLVERAQAGDSRAFRALYQLHHRAVFRYAIIPLVRDRHLAEDLLADTFVRAMENLHRFSWQGKGLLPWLIRIGKNLCLDYLRRAQKVAAWPEGLEHNLPDPTDHDAESAVSMVEMADLIGERLTACMAELNPRYRKVLRLRLVDKLPRADAATEMEVSVGTLDVLLFRACKAFRKIYAKRYGAHTEHPEFLK